MSDIKKYNCVEFKALLRENNKLSLVLVNIDSFSNLNLSYGTDNGDFIFLKVMELLNALHIPGVEIYKLESDEFAIVNKTNYDVSLAEDTAKLIISFFNETEITLLNGLDINLSMSIGISIGQGIRILNDVRLAIKELREHTRGSYIVYNMESPYIRAVENNVYWINKIQESIANDKIYAFFQPIHNNKTNKIEKYECLARIKDKGEFVSPYYFMDAAKEIRALPHITRTIIKKAFEMFSTNNYDFSINVTNDDLQLNYLEEYLLRNAKLFNVEQSRVTLELLEDIPSLDNGTTLSQLNSLRDKGFKISIDDFGAESSNFSRLLEFTPDYIKIDGAFIKDLIMDNKSQIITQAIVKIGHGMNIKVIAEYVHDEYTQEEVTILGVDYSQGYLHGAPSQTLVED